jgi:hypothetical protein
MSEDTTENQENAPKEPTPAELAEMRQRMKTYYEEQIPFLKVQNDYESLLADIEENRARRINMSIRIAQMVAGPPLDESLPEKKDPATVNDNPPVPETEKGPRKLKNT